MYVFVVVTPTTGYSQFKTGVGITVKWGERDGIYGSYLPLHYDCFCYHLRHGSLKKVPRVASSCVYLGQTFHQIMSTSSSRTNHSLPSNVQNAVF
jgi:hypothetical protein